MLKNIKNILSMQYFKSILQLTAGSLAAQLITVAIAPVSTRLYTAEQLGTYTLIITFVSIFGPVMCGKYDLAIVTADNEKEAVDLIAGGTLFILVFTLITAAGYQAYLHNNPSILEETGQFAYLLIAILMVTGFINILTSYNNRHKEYSTIASVNVKRTLVQNIGLIVFGLLRLGSVGLLLSQFCSILTGIKAQGRHLYRNRHLIKKLKVREICRTLFRYRGQPLFSMPAHFINSTAYSILNFFISSLFGMRVFGYYALSYRILGLPLSLVSMNVSIVFFKRAAEEKAAKGNYNSTLMQVTLFMSCISILMVAFLIELGPYAFGLVFGDEWRTSGVFAKILAPMYGLRFVVSALTPALVISGEQRLELAIQSLFIISSMFSYYVSKSFGLDMNIFLTVITIAYSFIYIVLYIIIYKLSKKRRMQYG